MALLEVKDLHATVGEREILKGIDLAVNAGQVHAIMGPNGSGKSTLAGVLAGREIYHVTAGQVLYDGTDLLEMAPEERARQGIFLAFQYPVEIPGVSNMYFLKAALNTIRKNRGLPELDAMDFLNLVREKMKLLDMEQALLNRSVNTGFSGGEKKRNEIFQMAVLEPRLAILDETDSGLDIDARAAKNWPWSSNRGATPGSGSRTKRRRSASHDGGIGTDWRLAGQLQHTAACRGLAPVVARSGVSTLCGTRVPDHQG